MVFPGEHFAARSVGVFLARLLRLPEIGRRFVLRSEVETNCADMKFEQFQRIYLQNIIDNALLDGAYSVRYEGDQHGNLSMYGMNPMNIIHCVFDTIMFSLGYNSNDIEEFKLYIPFILILDVDGFYIYKLDNDESKGTISHRLYPKEFFSHTDSEGVYAFDADFNIKIFDKSDKSLLHYFNASDFEEVSEKKERFLFLDSSDLKKKISDLIYDQINESIQNAVNSHNSLTRKKGVFYEFDWNIDRYHFDLLKYNKAIAFMVQGLPTGRNKTFSYLEFHKLQVQEDSVYYGFTKDKIRYYTDQDPSILGFEAEEIFSNSSEASKSGYFKWKREKWKKRSVKFFPF